MQPFNVVYSHYALEIILLKGSPDPLQNLPAHMLERITSATSF